MAEEQYPNSYISFEETAGKPIAIYVCLDQQGRRVIINPKNPSKHQSSHPLESNPTVHFNLHMVLQQPDSVEPSVSQTPKAIQHRSDGEVLVYKKKDFIGCLNLPGDQHGDIEVVVKYEDPEKIQDSKNYSLTYMVKH